MKKTCTMQLTPNEEILLTYLRRNARASLTSMARGTHIPLSTVSNTIKRLKEMVIVRYTTFVDFGKLGYPISVQFIIESNQDKKGEEFLMNSLSVNSLSRLSELYGFLVTCVFKDVKEKTDFKEKLESLGIRVIEEIFIIETIKKEEFVQNIHQSLTSCSFP
ncbi:Lrp/AsnC family transcriptional regulator [Candidatus Woesearchaeota archaeon]|nr:Lrp/AsnC family transcriptional regulator [Candidatus Woesearchaeota archaeon]